MRPLQYETPTASKMVIIDTQQWRMMMNLLLRLLIPTQLNRKREREKETIDPRINNKHEANHPRFVLINRANTANDEHSNANANEEASEVVTVVNIHSRVSS